MTNLNQVNFMSKNRFDNLSYTNDDELYVVEATVPDDDEVVHKDGTETIVGSKTFTSEVIGTSTSSKYPSGFLSQATTWSWGRLADSSYTKVTNWAVNGGEVSYATKDNQLSMQVDGFLYQNEGQHQVLDVGTEQSITGHKTFTGRVDFSGTGDTNAVYLTTDTRFDVYGSTNTVLGFISGTYTLGHTNFGLNLRGSGTRPNYNGNSMALYSDTTDKAPLASPALTGTPTSTTPSTTDNSTRIATTEWVTNHRCTSSAGTSSTASIYAPAYIVENYCSGTEWYRVYSDGWIEQGGHTTDGTNPRVVTFLKTMSDTNYTILYGNDNSWTSSALTYSRVAMVYSKSTTGFSTTGIYQNAAGTDYQFYWFVCGY